MKEYLINSKKYRLRTFEKIETPYHGYLIGYLAGDGSFSRETHKRLARLFVSSSEENIINGFKEYFCPDSAITKKWPVNNTPGRNINATKYSYVLSFSSKFYDTFNKFGILSKKESRKLVNISKKTMKSYVHGLFDADGHISWGVRKDRNRLWVNIGITHQSLDILTKVQRFLEEDLKITSSILQRKDEKCMDLKFSNRNNACTFVNWLYSDRKDYQYNLNKEKHAKAFVTAFEE